MASSSFFFLLLLLLPPNSASAAAHDCDPRCRTDNCDSHGTCLCDLPANSTMLLGDRPFLGGKFCDTPRTMCDGSNSFWCQNGTCNEIVQGESYACICEEGYAGDHCELEGAPCGDLYCFHNAECIQAADSPCACPSDWKGSEDCSKPTSKSTETDKHLPSSSTRPNVEQDGHDKWYLLPVGIAALIAVAAALFRLRSMRKRSEATKFYRLDQQVQMQGFAEEDDEAANFVYGGRALKA